MPRLSPILVALLLAVGCGSAPAPNAPGSSVSATPANSTAPEPTPPEPASGNPILPVPCPEVSFRATYLIDGIGARPEHGVVDELGNLGDMVWTSPAPGPIGRVIRVDLFVGKTHYAIADPVPVTVRGVRGFFGSIEDGYALEWREGPGVCGFFHIEYFGGASKAGLIKFADGLRRTS